MIEKIKKNWQVILICVLVLFSMNKCTVSCNRQGEIDRLNAQIEQMDSTYKYDVSERDLKIELLMDSLDDLNKDYKHLIDKFNITVESNSRMDEANRRADAANRRAASESYRANKLEKENQELKNQENEKN